MLSINTNLSSLIAQQSMKTSTDKLNQAIERMTTGSKINHAKDNAANYSIATNMTTKMGAYQVAEENALMGLDMVSTASESLSLIEDKLQRLRALATQVSNGTYGEQSKQAINAEANALVDEIERVYNTTEYNKSKLFHRVDGIKRSYSDEKIANMKTLSKAIEDSELVAGGEYSISSAEELAKLANIVNNGLDTTGMTFVLANDIDLAQWCKEHEDTGGWVPIGTHTNRFKGTFDGNGHTVKNIYINRSTKTVQGFFGATLNSEIRNLTIESGTVIGLAYVGGLVGINSTNSGISNCHAIVDVIGKSSSEGMIGGLVGYNFSGCIIQNSSFKGSVSGTAVNVGGLVGYCNASPINNSYATGSVEGHSFVGGLVGYNVNSDINFSFSESNVVATCRALGGFVGDNIGSNIYNCYATGNVVSEYNNTDEDTWAGGFVGRNNSGCIISNCYSVGNVTGYEKCLGGFAGQNISGQISNCYSSGNVFGRDKYTAGFVGYAGGGTINSCYSTGEVSSITSFTVEGFSATASNIIDCATSSKLLSSIADNITLDEIKSRYTNEYMGFTQENGWVEINGEKILTWQKEAHSTNNKNLQVGINGNENSRIQSNLGFSILGVAKLRDIGIGSENYLEKADLLLGIISAKQTEYGAVENRLMSVLDEISIQYENLASSRSTIRDADIAEVSSEYIQQQILQQASATLMATANQSPSIALQLI